MFYWNKVEIKCDNFFERTRTSVEGESGVDFMGFLGGVVRGPSALVAAAC